MTAGPMTSPRRCRASLEGARGPLRSASALSLSSAFRPLSGGSSQELATDHGKIVHPRRQQREQYEPEREQIVPIDGAQLQPQPQFGEVNALPHLVGSQDQDR